MCTLICTFQDSHISYFSHRQVLEFITLLPSVLDFVKYITMFMFVFRSHNSNIMSKHVYAATVSDSHSFYVILLQILKLSIFFLNFFPTYFLVVSASFIQYFSPYLSFQYVFTHFMPILNLFSRCPGVFSHFCSPDNYLMSCLLCNLSVSPNLLLKFIYLGIGSPLVYLIP